MKVVLSVALVLISSVALAQQPSPESQALAQKLMAEINANIQCSAAGITLAQQLKDAQARIKALEDRYEPKTSEPKTPEKK